jgi:hypothetical protein
LKHIILGFICLSILSTLACSKSGEGPRPSQAKKTGNPGPKHDDSNDVESTVLSEGSTYISDCLESSSQYGTINFPRSQKSYIISGDSFTRTKVMFSSPNCVTPAVVIQEAGTLSAIENSKKSQLGSAHKFSFKKSLITVNDEFILNMFNDNHVCGFLDWVLGAPKEVNTQTDDINTEVCPSLPSPRDEIKLLTVKHYKLFFGESAGDSSQTIPQNIDFKNGYSKN